MCPGRALKIFEDVLVEVHLWFLELQSWRTLVGDHLRPLMLD